MYQVDWFSPHIRPWLDLLAKYKDQPVNFLEIGCFEGKATVWLLENILTHNDSRISVIDTFKGSWEHQGMNTISMKQNFLENIANFKNKVDVYTGESKKIVPKLKDESFDFIYVDGSHEAVDVLRDGVLAWDKLKKGGMIIFDDYTWGSENLTPQHRPYFAIVGLLNVLGTNCKSLQVDDQMVIWKK